MQSSLFTDDVVPLVVPDAQLSYQPGFINDHRRWYEQLRQSICWQQDRITLYGQDMPIPRLNAWYGDEGMDYSYSGIQLKARPWNEPLLDLKRQLERSLNVTFNSVLANYYRDGNDSVSWHADDEPELGSQPLIASLSFGEPRRFSLRHKTDRSLPVQHIDLEGGSLLVMAGETQRYWHHQLPKSRHSIAGRINLTFRSIISRPGIT
jgi:alkylated DNA repair dioxygenase AlkB